MGSIEEAAKRIAQAIIDKAPPPDLSKPYQPMDHDRVNAEIVAMSVDVDVDDFSDIPNDPEVIRLLAAFSDVVDDEARVAICRRFGATMNGLRVRWNYLRPVLAEISNRSVPFIAVLEQGLVDPEGPYSQDVFYVARALGTTPQDILRGRS